MKSGYTIDDLPKFSPWPGRLLGLDPWQGSPKTPEHIEREFGVEKWGALLSRARETPSAVTLDTVDNWALSGAGRGLVSVGSELFLMEAAEAHAAYIEFIAGVLEPCLPATALVELGAGYGSVILALARRPGFEKLPLIAADYTESGPAVISLIARNEGRSVGVGRCDLSRDPVTSVDIPQGALIYTAYAAQYIPMLGDSFVSGLARLRPSTVVNIEPVYEHCDTSTLLGLLRHRYIQANDYNRNLATLLHQHAEVGSIELIVETRAAFGPNPLLAASVLAWRPAS